MHTRLIAALLAACAAAVVVLRAPSAPVVVIALLVYMLALIALAEWIFGGKRLRSRRHLRGPAKPHFYEAFAGKHSSH